METTLRQRRIATATPPSRPEPEKVVAEQDEVKDQSPKPPVRLSLLKRFITSEITGPTYEFSRFLMIRLFGFVSLCAFLSAYDQNAALVGETGILPAIPYIARLRGQFDSTTSALLHTPSIFWLVEPTTFAMSMVAFAGIIASTLLIFRPHAPYGLAAALVAVCYFAQHGILHVGQTFYAFGWETQILETALVVFLLALPPSNGPPPTLAVWLMRWLIFRISIGAGLIKARAGRCWGDYTCLNYHFETQPAPSPSSWLWHSLPHSFHAAGVATDFAVQLYAVWAVLVPIRTVSAAGSVLQAAFMLNIAASGNFSLLNWLTLIPAVAGIDDATWQLLGRVARRIVAALPFGGVICAVAGVVREPLEHLLWGPARTRRAAAAATPSRAARRVRSVVALAATVVVGYLSVSIVQNLMSPHQQMNASFDSWHLVNTYGAFGSVGESRHELIIEVQTNDTAWTELRFHGKPSAATVAPTYFAPYHHRLAWGIWFLGFPPHDYRYHPWVLRLFDRILAGDASVLAVLDNPPSPPFVGLRSRMYHYQFVPPAADAVVEKGTVAHTALVAAEGVVRALPAPFRGWVVGALRALSGVWWPLGVAAGTPPPGGEGGDALLWWRRRPHRNPFLHQLAPVDRRPIAHVIQQVYPWIVPDVEPLDTARLAEQEAARARAAQEAAYRAQYQQQQQEEEFVEFHPPARGGGQPQRGVVKNGQWVGGYGRDDGAEQ